MLFWKTLLVYSNWGEAAVDQSLIESNGIAVNLLNDNTARSQLGLAFQIQLQVPADRLDEARSILHAMRPERFGEHATVRAIERALFRSVTKSLAFILTACLVSYILGYFIYDQTGAVFLIIGLFIAIFSLVCWSFFRRLGVYYRKYRFAAFTVVRPLRTWRKT